VPIFLTGAAAVEEIQPVAVYDHAGSLVRMGKDLGLFRDMIGFLRDDSPRWLAQLRAGLESHDDRRVRHAAHSLKGLAANFGAPRVEKAARTVEKGAGQLDWQELQLAAGELEQALEELLTALRPFASTAEPV
jgi:HPt (histidine-containing phosphotransfer) domain-containing protein